MRNTLQQRFIRCSKEVNMDEKKDVMLSVCYPVNASDFAAAGEVSRMIKQSLKKLGIQDSIVRRVAIAAYEAEMNIVIHTLGGVMLLEVTPVNIILNAKDKGPGIADIEMAMSEGYSTAPDTVREMGFGAGMGLSNMKRCADDFVIESRAGGSTEITMKFNL